MPTIHWGSLVVGLIVGIMLYHFSKNRVGAGAQEPAIALALGLVAALVGADLVIAGITKRPFTSLMFGKWDAPDAAGASSPAATSGNAKNGGTYKPAPLTPPPGSVDPVGQSHVGTPESLHL